MRWVSFQPTLRRIYGCSFLPYHDYGKGGRGWRDMWQDCLALLLMNPDGVRMDGQPLVLSQEDVRVILPRTEIEKLSDEVHEIEIWLGKGEERQR